MVFMDYKKEEYLDLSGTLKRVDRHWQNKHKLWFSWIIGNFLYFYWIFGYWDIHLTNVNQLVQMYNCYQAVTRAVMPDFGSVIITF